MENTENAGYGRPTEKGGYGMPIALALCEVKRLKEEAALVGRVIGAAQAGGGGRWDYGVGGRTKDSVLEVVYPGISVNELREWRKNLQDALEELQSCLKAANWESGTQAKLERLEKLDRDIKRASEDIIKNVRVYEAEVLNVPNVVELLNEIQGLYDERSLLAYEIQRANMEVLVTSPEG